MESDDLLEDKWKINRIEQVGEDDPRSSESEWNDLFGDSVHSSVLRRSFVWRFLTGRHRQ